MTKPDRTLPSNVYQTHNRYYVAQTVNYERIVYGRYDTPEEAIERRNQLVQEGTIIEHNGKHRIKNYEDRYITKKSNTMYQIMKWYEGELQYFCVFHSLKVAREERDFLERIGWDYGNMY